MHVRSPHSAVGAVDGPSLGRGAAPVAPSPPAQPRGGRRRAAVRTPATPWTRVDVRNVSKAGGDFPVDWVKARADAQKVIDTIDFSKRDIVIWVPGTDSHGVHRDFDAATHASWGAVAGGGASIVALEHDATWNLRSSVATGIATLKYVLQEIQRRGGRQRVLLSGESQGAWIAGEAIADPKLGAVVDRAVLIGHPWLAAHQYTDGHDPRVAVINHRGDQVTMPVNGDPAVVLDAMVAVRTLELDGAGGTILQAILANPLQAIGLLKEVAYALPFVKSLLVNPHEYGNEMTRAVEFLRYGKLDDGGATGAESELSLRRRYAAEALEAQRRMRAAGFDITAA